MDGHDVPDRAAGRFGSRGADHARRAAGRRQLPAHRPQDLHHLGRPPHGREHHPPRACAAAGRAAGHQGHLAVPRAEVQAQCRRHARRAQRRVPGLGRAQARHPREPDLRAGLRRQRRRAGLPGRHAERRPRRDVHDDELHAARRRRAGRGPRRALLPGVGRYARDRVQGRAPGEKGRVRDHPAPRRAPHAAADAFAHAGLARDLLLHGLVPRSRHHGDDAGDRRPRGRRAAT